MPSGQVTQKAAMLAALIVAFPLCTQVAIAGTNDDFLKAAKRGDLAAVKALIAKGIDVNTTSDDGATALHLASVNNHANVVKLLLARGANINAAYRSGRTPLILASERGYVEIAQVLLSRRADVNARYNAGQTAPMVASYHGYTEIVRLLLDNGADINARDSSLAKTALGLAVAKNHSEVARLLASRGGQL